MRKTFLAMAAAMALASPAMAEEVTWPRTPRDAKAFVQNMPADAWQKIVVASVNLRFLVGRPIVAVINSNDEEVVSLVCDSKWALVGNNAYHKDKGAPANIPARSVGFIPTDDFDKYCKTSLVALTEDGTQHNATLSIPGDFTNSTAIFIAK